MAVTSCSREFIYYAQSWQRVKSALFAIQGGDCWADKLKAKFCDYAKLDAPVALDLKTTPFNGTTSLLSVHPKWKWK
jgi:hypothetical protein